MIPINALQNHSTTSYPPQKGKANLNRGSVLYLRFDTGGILNIQNGPDSEGTLRSELAYPGHRVRLDLRARTASVNGNTTHLSAFPFISSPTYAADEVECMIDLE